MDEQRIGAFLKAIGSAPVPSQRSGWVVARCPLAPWTHGKGQDKNPSFGVRIEPGDSRCHCFSCHFAGSQTMLVQRLGDLKAPIDKKTALQLIAQAEDEDPIDVFDIPDYGEVKKVSQPEPFPEHLLEAMEPAVFEGVCHPYLAEREVSAPIAGFLDIRYDDYRDRIVFPVRDFAGRLVGLHGRACGNQQPKYLMYPWNHRTNPMCWLGEHWVDLDRPVVMVESVFDLARTLEVYRNVVTPLTSSLWEDKLSRMAGATEIVTIFDADEAGDLARQKVKEKYKSASVRHVYLELGQDPGDTPAEELYERLEHLVDVEAFFLQSAGSP